MNTPFYSITGLGSGFSYSSYNQLSNTPNAVSLGQAKLASYVNLLTGNLVISDHVIKISEANGVLNLGFTYNSQTASATEAWQFTLKRLTKTPDGQSAILREEDGHLTEYNITADSNYSAPGLNDGTPYLIPDPVSQGWQWCHPKTGDVEYYDSNGCLVKREDALGRTNTYIYDENGNLQTITGPSGASYKISRAADTIGLYLVNNGNESLLQHYSLDNQGKIETTQLPGGYKIQYEYYPDNTLKSITQDDGTAVSFTYENGQVVSWQQGETILYDFTYPSLSNPDIAIIQDGCKNQTLVMMDPATGLTQQISKQTGFDQEGAEIDTTSYQYNQQNQLQTVITPGGGVTRYEYNETHGLLSKVTGANGQITQYQYYQTLPPRIAAKTQVLNGKNLVTHFIYDTSFFDGKPFLRFEISPEGRVKEYLPDEQGNIASKREYLADQYHAIPDVDLETALKQLNYWVNAQDPQQITLSEFTYDGRGNIESVKHYASIDAEGNGIEDEAMAYEEYFHDEFGNLLIKDVKYSQTDTATTDQRFDDLQRLTSTVDPLYQKTAYQYELVNGSTQVSVRRPNNRIETKTLDAAGLTIVDSAVIDGKNDPARTSSFERDSAGRVFKTILPDGNVLYTFYDRQDRIGIKITPTGIVTRYIYDEINNYRSTTIYANRIDTSTISLASTLIDWLTKNADPENDRTSYEFYDLSGRLAYEVDARNVARQHGYDDLNRETGQITYVDQLTAAQLLQLQSRQALNPPLQYQFGKDRRTLIYYDKDGKKIATQDAAGYVTQYIRNGAGKTIKKKCYANPVPPTPGITEFAQQALIIDSKNDADTYYIRNGRGQIIAEIDAGGYLTTYTYLPCGLREQQLRYATKINVGWFANTNIMPDLPASSSEDQLTKFKYDLLGRLTEIEGPVGENKSYTFDIMGNKTSQQILDAYEPENTDGDHRRGTKAIFDEWDQLTNLANPYINQLLAQTDVNQANELWQKQSIRNKFDATGLKISSTDTLNHTSYYFYDNERRPVAKIDPTGAVIESVLNVFGEPVEHIAYKTRLSRAEMQQLSGGFITETLRSRLNELKKSGAHVIQIKRDRSGNIVKKIDANQNISEAAYNSFNEIEKEFLPVQDKNPSLVIQHEYEGRGLEVKTTKIADNKQIVTETKYANLYGKPTDHIDENKGLHQTLYNPLGQITETIDPVGNSKHFQSDPFDRIETEIDTLNNKTTHVYNQQGRSHTVNYPANNTSVTTTDNVFGQKVTEKDGEGGKQQWQHAPDGKQTQYIDQVGNITTDNYDTESRHTEHVDAKGVVNKKAYNSAGQLRLNFDDANGTPQVTRYLPDAFGNPELVISPAQIVTHNSFDGNNNQETTAVDPAGLNLITTRKFNGQNTFTQLVRGDAATPALYTEQQIQDGFNRSIGSVIDPTNLQISQTKALDNAGNVNVETDANGNIKWNFYDKFNNQRFVIDAEGGVYERFYDSEQRLQFERHYRIGIDPGNINTKTSIDDLIKNYLKPDPQDTLTWYYYDENGNERFRVNSLGIVTEKRYNKCNKCILDIAYAQQINNPDFTALNTQTLIQFATDQSGAPKNRLIYHIRDTNQGECFTIDAKGYLIQTIYDGIGNPIVKVQYEQCLQGLYDLSTVAAMRVDDIRSQIIPAIKNDDLDHYAYQMFDNFNRPLYSISPEGQVTAYQHDSEHNLIQTCRLKQTVNVPDDYANLLAQVKKFAPQEGVDRIVRSDFDKGNRKLRDTVPMGGEISYIDQYFPDACGNVKSHVDANGNEWKSVFDSANRLNTEITPPVNVTTVRPEANNTTLQPSFSTVSIEKQHVYSKTGKDLQITEAANTSDARTIKFQYNKRDQLTGTTIENVNVDDGTQPASFTNPPVKTINITISIVYDAKSNKVAEKNENGQWTFYVYDSENREIFCIDQIGGVIEYERDAFGDIVSQTKYNNLINLDLSQYTATGIPIEKMYDDGLLKPDASDRITLYERDNRGDIVTNTLPRMFYYLPKLNGKPSFGYANPQTTYCYDAFRNQVKMSQLYDPINNIWAQNLKWFDRNKKIIADCDAINRVKIYEYNSFGDENKRWEWASQPTSVPGTETTFKQLLTAYQKNPAQRDHLYIKDFDVRGLVTIETRGFRQDDGTITETIQETELTSNGPVMHDKEVPGKSVSYEYDGVKNCIAKIYEDNSRENYYFNAMRLQIGMTGVPRSSVDDDGQPVTLIPLEWTSHNALGQKNSRFRFKQGAASPVDSKHLPLPIVNDSEDQLELTCHNNRGLPDYRLDANGNMTGYTFNADCKQLAREYYPSSSWQMINGAMTVVPRIDEKRFVFDRRGQVINTYLLSNNTLERSIAAAHNTFGNLTEEGAPDLQAEHTYNFTDNNGLIWRSNAEKNVPIIKWYNLLLQETSQVRSANMNLQEVGYDDQDKLCTQYRDQVEISQQEKDLSGRVITTIGPGIFPLVQSKEQILPPSNIELNICVGADHPEFGKTSLSWEATSNSFGDISQTITIYPIANPQKQKTIPVRRYNGRYGVDISDLSTDVYAFVVKYQIPDSPMLRYDREMIYSSAGLVQVDAGEAPNSESFIAVADGFKVTLKGNTDNLQSVLLNISTSRNIEINVQRDENNQCYLDLSDYPSGDYTLSSNTGKPVLTPPFTLGNPNTPGGKKFATAKGMGAAPLSHPVTSIELDAWNNIIKRKDVFGNITTMDHNIDNQVTTTIEPPVSAIDDSNNVITTQPISISGYNIRGLLIGETDPNNHTIAHILDDAGQEIQTILGDGSIEREEVFDALSRPVKYKNSSGKTGTRKYDRNNNIIVSTSPMQRTSEYTLNRDGKRIKVVLPGTGVKPVYLYNYSVAGDITQTILPSNQYYNMISDINHLWIQLSDSDGNTQILNRDYGGNIQQQQYYNGLQIYFDRDYKKQVTHEYTINQNGSFNVQTTGIAFDIQTRQKYEDVIYLDSNRNINYGYVGDSLVEVTDAAQSTLSRYLVDPLARINQSVFIGQPVKSVTGSPIDYYEYNLVHRINRDSDRYARFESHANITARFLDYSHSIYDPIGRESYINTSGLAQFSYGYDAKGNIRLFTSQIGSNAVGAYWNSFNAADYITLYKGINDSGVIKLAPGGMQYSWVNNLRATQSYLDSSNKVITDQLGYDDDEWIISKTSSNGGALVVGYDDAGWIKNVKQTNTDKSVWTQSLNCDANGWLQSFQQNWSDNQKIVVNYSNFNAQGLPRQQDTHYADPDPTKWVNDHVTEDYVGFDHFVPVMYKGSRQDNYGWGPTLSTQLLWDANANFSGTVKSSFRDGVDKYVQDTWLLDTPSDSLRNWASEIGTYVRKHDGSFVQRSISAAAIASFGPFYNYRDNNTPLAVDNHLRERLLYNASGDFIASVYDDQWAYTDFNAATQSTLTLPDVMKSLTASFIPKPDPNADDRHIKIIDSLNTEAFPLQVPERYMVNPMDDFEKIAKSRFTQRKDVLQIARFNDFDADDVPQPGYVLRMPQVMPKYCQQHAHSPFDRLLNAIMDQITPQLVAKAPPLQMIYVRKVQHKKKHGGWFRSHILNIVVDCIIVAAACAIGAQAGVAVGTYLFGSAAAVGATATSTALAVEALASAVVAGVIDAVGQEAAVAMGFQEHFSLNQAVFVGVSSGISMFGKPDLSMLGKGLKGDIGEIGKALYISGRAAVMQQLLLMETSKTAFNIRNIAASMTASMAGAAIDANVDNGALQTLTKVTASMSSNVMFGQRNVGIDRMVASMLGSAIGAQLGKAASAPVNHYVENEAKDYNAMLFAREQAAAQQSPSTTSNQQSQGMQRFGMFSIKPKSSHLPDWYVNGSQQGMEESASMLGKQLEIHGKAYGELADRNYAAMYENSKASMDINSRIAFGYAKTDSQMLAKLNNEYALAARTASSASLKQGMFSLGGKALGPAVTLAVSGYEFAQDPTIKNGFVVGAQALAGTVAEFIGGPFLAIPASMTAGYGATAIYDWTAVSPATRIPAVVASAAFSIISPVAAPPSDTAKNVDELLQSLRPRR